MTIDNTSDNPVNIEEINTADKRGEIIEQQRGDRVLLGAFYLVNEQTQLSWSMPDPTLLDTETFAACMSQLIVTFMVHNPDESELTIMKAVQRAMMDLAKQGQAE